MNVQHQTYIPKRHREHGFSLVELVVIIMIILFLLALLLPAVQKARSKAEGAVCLNNQRQLMLAWIMYSEDNNSLIPAAGKVEGIPDWTGGGRLSQGGPDLQSSPLLPYLGGALPVFQCPKDPTDRKLSRSMNAYAGGPEPEENETGAWLVVKGTKDFRRISPSNFWIMIDEHPDSIDDGRFKVDMTPNPKTRILDFPASYHSRAATVGFADGHVEIHKWIVEDTLWNKGGHAKISRGSVSHNNVDLQWLQERTTVRIPNASQ